MKSCGALTVLKTTHPKCSDCGAKCCQYSLINIDAPQDAEDFDFLRFNILHNLPIYVEFDEDGFEYSVMIPRRCAQLGSDGLCTIYETRPQICQDYDPDDGCEKDNDGTESITLRTEAELERFRTGVWLPLVESVRAARRASWRAALNKFSG